MDAVFWIEGSPPVPLAIVLCPYGGSILKDELHEIARSGVQTLVSLLEPTKPIGLASPRSVRLLASWACTFFPIRFRTFTCQ